MTVESRLPNDAPSYIYEGNDAGQFEDADGPTLNRAPRQIQDNVDFIAQQVDIRTNIVEAASSPHVAEIGSQILVSFSSGTVALSSTNASTGETISLFVPAAVAISVRLDSAIGTVIDTINGAGFHQYRYNGSTFTKLVTGSDIQALYDSIHGRAQGAARS